MTAYESRLEGGGRVILGATRKGRSDRLGSCVGGESRLSNLFRSRVHMWDSAPADGGTATTGDSGQTTSHCNPAAPIPPAAAHGRQDLVRRGKKGQRDLVTRMARTTAGIHARNRTRMIRTLEKRRWWAEKLHVRETSTLSCSVIKPMAVRAQLDPGGMPPMRHSEQVEKLC